MIQKTYSSVCLIPMFTALLTYLLRGVINVLYHAKNMKAAATRLQEISKSDIGPP